MENNFLSYVSTPTGPPGGFKSITKVKVKWNQNSNKFRLRPNHTSIFFSAIHTVTYMYLFLFMLQPTPFTIPTHLRSSLIQTWVKPRLTQYIFLIALRDDHEGTHHICISGWSVNLNKNWQSAFNKIFKLDKNKPHERMISWKILNWSLEYRMHTVNYGELSLKVQTPLS